MIKYLLIFVAVFGLGLLFWPLLQDFTTATELNDLSQAYISGAREDLNMPNVVTAIVVSYRGLDTLGEVSVLFLATAGIGFLLKKRHKALAKRRNGSEILQTGASFLAPLIIVFGTYIFSHGHLSPGGGFQGGVVVASAFLLLTLAYPSFHFSHRMIHWLESLSGLSYLLIGILGLVLLGVHSFLDPRILPAGKWLHLFSGGAVPIIYSIIGIKVGSELSSVIDALSCGGGDRC